MSPPRVLHRLTSGSFRLTLQELCTGGDLYARIPYQEADVARVLYQVLSALIYMHDRNVVHRDLYVPTG